TALNPTIRFTMTDLANTMQTLGRNARRAARLMAAAPDSAKAAALRAMADLLLSSREALQAANALDLAAAEERDLAPAMLDRLRLSDKALNLMAEGLRQIADMPDPV